MCPTAAAPPTSTPADQQAAEPRLGSGERLDELERRKTAEATPGSDKKSGDGEGGKSGLDAEGEGGGGGAGTLVLHVRSGDIFDKNVLAYYGQVHCMQPFSWLHGATLLEVCFLGIVCERLPHRKGKGERLQ